MFVVVISQNVETFKHFGHVTVPVSPAAMLDILAQTSGVLLS